MIQAQFKVGVVGNPNSGKSTLFNVLTGLDQQVGNFPGVTVEKAEGKIYLEKEQIITLIDFPGSYSVHANTSDEFVLTEHLLHEEYTPQGLIYVLDLRNIDQQLLLLMQVIDLKFPIIIVITNTDHFSAGFVARVKQLLHSKLSLPVIDVNYKSKKGIPEIYAALNKMIANDESFLCERNFNYVDDNLIKELKLLEQKVDSKSIYEIYLLKHYRKKIYPKREEKFVSFQPEESINYQIQETLNRYKILDQWVQEINNNQDIVYGQNTWTKKLDRYATHPVFGFLIFFGIMYILFLAIFSWASYPMDAIELGFSSLSNVLREHLPVHWLTSLVVDGLIAGLSGVLVFIPQIAILFFLIGYLEECGYMARVVYLFDYFLRKFGLNGRSVVGLISGGACAVPAMMSTRTIPSRSERLATLFIIPLIPCSARIPVYVVLIAFLIPATAKVLGIFSAQVLIFFGLYLLGIIVALLTALVLKSFLPKAEKSYLLIQLPDYQLPYLKKIFIGALQKVKSFVLEAGKVILIISVVLWFLSSFSFPGEFTYAEKKAADTCVRLQLTEADCNHLHSSEKLEHSFAGKLGKLLEPIIKPLGFDWKIGIALVTSFAAREVFVGTMSTIYQLGSDAEQDSLHERLFKEKRDDGTAFFNFKTALSLILFYAFALQCMSTISIMRRETGGWRWPIIQLIVLSAIAYLSSLLVYQFC